MKTLVGGHNTAGSQLFVLQIEETMEKKKDKSSLQMKDARGTMVVRIF